MTFLLYQVGAAVQQVKSQYPDPIDVGNRVSNDVMVAHQKAQVTAWRAQADCMSKLAQEKAQGGVTILARALKEWAETIQTQAVAQEQRMASPEYQEWLVGRQEWLAECEIE